MPILRFAMVAALMSVGVVACSSDDGRRADADRDDMRYPRNDGSDRVYGTNRGDTWQPGDSTDDNQRAPYPSDTGR